MSERELSLWEQQVKEDPQHSHWYVERFRKLAADGVDIVGEARLIDAMSERGSRVLDAGCGPGRVGAYLRAQGHEVVGVDVDPVLIEAAKLDYPGPRWLVGDLAALNLGERFDLIVCAGNVLTFVAPSTRVAVLNNLRAHLAERGRLVTGFGAGRDYDFETFFHDCQQAGLGVEQRFATWDLRPFTPESEFLVTVLSSASGRDAG